MDLKTGTRKVCTFEPGDQVSEPVFVPRSETAAEGEGWLTAVVWRSPAATSAVLRSFSYAYDAAGMVTNVGLQDGTIEFSATLWDYSLGRFGFDVEVFDAQYYDQEPVIETPPS
jgi:hypothetical protein